MPHGLLAFHPGKVREAKGWIQQEIFASWKPVCQAFSHPGRPFTLTDILRITVHKILGNRFEALLQKNLPLRVQRFICQERNTPLQFHPDEVDYTKEEIWVIGEVPEEGGIFTLVLRILLLLMNFSLRLERGRGITIKHILIWSSLR